MVCTGTSNKQGDIMQKNNNNNNNANENLQNIIHRQNNIA
jgi:hypothetical protein